MASTDLDVEHTPIRLSDPSPLPFGRSRDDACPVCLDLDYDLFKDTVQSKHLYVPHSYIPSRHHVARFVDIELSARGGCRLCAILYRGVAVYSGEDILKDELTFVNSMYEEQIKHAMNSGCKVEELDTTQENEVDEVSTVIFLELRPNRPLSFFSTKRFYWMLATFHNRMEFHTEPGFSLLHPAFNCAPRVPSCLEPARCTTILGNWLRICNTHHDTCLAPLPKLPRRLVYVWDHKVHLIETEGLAYAEYTTLSHCWGQATNMIKTTKNNIETRKANIDWNELSQIFKDAITVTKHVGCRWIWIDSLCIVQDDEKDWKEQSSKMEEVYSNSFLNIAATFSATSAGSCFSHRKFHYDDSFDPAQEKMPLTVHSHDVLDEFDGLSMGLCVRVAHWLGHDHVTSTSMWLRRQASPLLDRAWVFQERLLAPRTLHFGSSEMIWECNSCLACECTGIFTGTNDLKAAFADACQNRTSKDETLHLWRRMVEIYTSLSLTQVSDTPHAIAGVSSRFSDKLESDYLAGIWAQDLPRGLLWQSLGRPSSSTAGRRISSSSNQSIPTWSWMSLYHATHPGAAVSYLHAKDFDQDYRLRVHWCPSVTTCAGIHPFGDVPLGRLEITAVARLAKIESSRGTTTLRLIGKDGLHQVFVPDCAAEGWLGVEEEVVCLLLGTDNGRKIVLVLRPSIESGCYTRLGLDLWEGNFFEQAAVKRVAVR